MPVMRLTRPCSTPATLRAPAKSRPSSARRSTVLDVVPGEVGGAQQPRQRSPLGVLLVLLPVFRGQQRPDRLLIPSGGMRAGHVRPGRRERGQARGPVQVPPHRLGRRPLGLLPFQHAGQHGEPVRPRRRVPGCAGIFQAGRWPGFRGQVSGAGAFGHHVGRVPLAAAAHADVERLAPGCVVHDQMA